MFTRCRGEDISSASGRRLQGPNIRHKSRSLFGTGSELRARTTGSWDRNGRTLHERERVRAVERAIMVLRDRDLDSSKRLPDGKRGDGRVVRRYRARIGFELGVERSRPRQSVRVVMQESRDL